MSERGPASSGATPGVVIVGAGQAGGECAMRIRRNGYAGPITLIGDETHAPYQRPPLSKAILDGSASPDSVLLLPAEAYREAGITLLTGRRVTAIDRAARMVVLDAPHGTINGTAGDVLAYETLVLATGGQARRLRCPGAELDGVMTLRNLDDAARLRDALRPDTALVVVGGGYIGLEVAASAIKRGARATIVEAAPLLLARVACPELADYALALHRDAGATIHLGAAVEAFEAREAGAPSRLGAVRLSDGTRIPADLALVGIGLVPETGLARAACLAAEDGIEVDENCRTADAAIYAIGDCAAHANRFLGRRLRLESVPSATDQARIAADAITARAGGPTLTAPWFWSEQFGHKLQSVGLRDGDTETVRRGAADARSFLLFHLRDGAIVAADAVNSAADFMVARRLVGARAHVQAALLADPAVPLKSLLP